MAELACLGWVGKRRVEDPSDQWPDKTVVAVSRDTLAEKTGQHRDRPTDLKTFANAQALIDKGTIIDRGDRSQRSIVIERDGSWWDVAVARRSEGFLHLVNVHRVCADQVMKWLKKGKNADGWP